ncbi:MAG TPA: PQQ-dependent sugar dehydrogenase [Vicinamibacterales bacterium]
MQSSSARRFLVAPAIMCVCVAVAAVVGAQQQTPQGRAAQGGGGGGRGRGTPRPECVSPKIPAAECNVGAAPIQWNDPPLGDGPFLVESAVPAHRNLRVVVMARLQQPWSIAFLPDGNILVTERGGRLRIIRNGVLDPNPVAGVPKVQAAGLQGLMDVVLHPRFAENRYVYLSYHKPVPVPGAPPTASGAPAMAGETTLARGTWNGTALIDVRDIFESGATRTESSRIGFGRDGMLYMTISASGTGPDVFRSADPNDYAGKTVRLRDDGTIPPDNPFVNKPGYKPGIYTLGHRNGHSMALNPETGEFWVTEQGPNGGDEVNVLKPGANYGWPYVSAGRNYMGPKISDAPWKEGFEQAAVTWVPSIAVAGGTFYTGDRFAGWKRNFFVGGLREGETPRTGQLQRIEFNEKWEEIRREPMLRSLHQRIRDVRQGPDGLLYLVTGEDQGALLRIEPADAKP